MMNNTFFISKRYLLVTFLIACYSGLCAQSVLTFDTNAPGVGSLLRVEDASVNLYTGRPNISIPLHTISLKDYSYDIQLLYNAEGNKPDLPVSNVGLGWSITGGQIYRIANGYPDETETFSQYLDRTDMQDWNQESNLYRYYNNTVYNEDYLHEPDLDEFIINIGQINASFYMYKDREGKIVTKISSQNSHGFEVKDVQIGTFPEFTIAEGAIYHPYWDQTFRPKVSISPRPVLIKEITIVDSDGVTYIFGGDISSVDISCLYNQDPNYERYFDKFGRRIGNHNLSWEDFHSELFGTPSTWHIKKIILPNREKIEFDYSKGNVNIMERLNLYKSQTAKFTLEPISSSTITPSFLPDDVNPQYNLLENKTYDIVYPSLLKSIRASNGDFVDFTSSRRNDLPTHGYYDQWELFLVDNYGGAIGALVDKCYSFKLDEMKTKTGTVSFYYTDKTDRRLKLDSLRINRNEVYRFQYNPRLLPPYSHTLTDNWGYYNGRNYYSNRQLNFDNLYAFRQPDSTYVKAEILEKIIYPTGGEVHFEYELHTYSKIATQYPFEIKTENGFAGGVRIKKATYFDGSNPLTKKTKEFLYLNEDGTSSGILSVVPQYTASGSGRVDYDHKGISIHGSYNYTKKSDTHINWVDQFHIGYSRVTEQLSDGSKTVYSFVNHDQVKDESSSGDITSGLKDDLYHKYNSRKLARGLLQSVKYYGISDKLLKQEAFWYHTDWSDYLKSINHYSFMGLQPIRASANKIYTFFPFLQKKETILYTDHGNINETEEYEYNKYRLLTHTKKYTNNPNDNSILETNTKYLSDLMEEYDHDVSTSISPGSPLKVYDTMKSERLLSYPIETVVKRNGKVTSADVITYKLFEGFVARDKLFKLESNEPLDNYSPFRLVNSTESAIDERCTVEMEYLDYDSYHNPTNVVDKTGTNTAYVWGYGGLYPVAKVVNARNTFKSIPQYRDVRTTQYINLKYNPLSANIRTYNFYTSRDGDVEIILAGALGFNWYVSGRIDGNRPFNLIMMRSSDKVGRPWTEYQNAYTYSATFYITAGYHTFSINATDAYKESSANIYDGSIHFSYWTRESIAPETSGWDDVFYKNFETLNSSASSFGYHSNQSYIGTYTVDMATNPSREYFIDYQVFEAGTWHCVKHDFLNGHETIDEGNNPIDDIRVYPKDAFITTNSYFPLIGIRSKTNERGVSESYQYDAYGKLLFVMDNDLNIVKKHDYHYQGQTVDPEAGIYHNAAFRNLFTRNTCDLSLGEIGATIEYVVPAGKYSSIISQEDANQKAFSDLQNNGQQYANEHAECNSNIIVSVYNPTGMTCYLECDWGPQGGIVHDNYEIPPSDRIAFTGDVLQDFTPLKLYIPRVNYRAICFYSESHKYIPSSSKSALNELNLFYSIEYFPGFEDTYVVGGYPFEY